MPVHDNYKHKSGVLIVNLGTPLLPEKKELRIYLHEFLSDPRVIDINLFLRFLLLYLIILPSRPKKSAILYKKIWTKEGSPLLVYSNKFSSALQKISGDSIPIVLAMRYGKPSIKEGLEVLTKIHNVDNIVIFPQFPQYSSACTGSIIEAVFKELSSYVNIPSIQIIPPFFNNHNFIEAYAKLIKTEINNIKPDMIMISFHGLPVRQIKKSDHYQSNCLSSDNCCEVSTNSYCYRSQCIKTAKLIANELNINEDQYIVSFQSRLGKTAWIEPYTNDVMRNLIKKGVKKLLVACPSFTVDCLETLEEIGINAEEMFKSLGGDICKVVPCLNDDEIWVKGAHKIITSFLEKSV